jgi:MFS family permease
MSLSQRFGVNRIVLALSIARLADAMGNSMMIIVLPLYVVATPSPILSLPSSLLIGILVSTYGLVNIIGQPLMGALADRYSRRKRIILIGLLLMALATFSFGLANRFSQLLLIRVFQGFGVAMVVPATLALMTAATVRDTRGGSMGLYSTMRLVGFSVGPLLAGLLYEMYGFMAVFLVGGGLVLLGTVLVYLWVDESDLSVSEHPNEDKPFHIFDRAIWSREIVGLGAATVSMAAAYSMMSALENEFNARLDQTALGFGLAFSALTVGRMLVQFPLGRLSDRIGRKPVIVAGLLAMTPATVSLGLVGSTFSLAAARFIQGVASAAIASPALALVGDISHVGGEARQMSVVTTGFFLGTTIGPLIAGGLAIYSFELPFVVGGILSLLGALIVQRRVTEPPR